MVGYLWNVCKRFIGTVLPIAITLVILIRWAVGLYLFHLGWYGIDRVLVRVEAGELRLAYAAWAVIWYYATAFLVGITVLPVWGPRRRVPILLVLVMFNAFLGWWVWPELLWHWHDCVGYEPYDGALAWPHICWCRMNVIILIRLVVLLVVLICNRVNGKRSDSAIAGILGIFFTVQRIVKSANGQAPKSPLKEALEYVAEEVLDNTVDWFTDQLVKGNEAAAQGRLLDAEREGVRMVNVWKNIHQEIILSLGYFPMDIPCRAMGPPLPALSTPLAEYLAAQELLSPVGSIMTSLRTHVSAGAGPVVVWDPESPTGTAIVPVFDRAERALVRLNRLGNAGRHLWTPSRRK